jgi:haloalkane dehalogenase
MVGVKPDGQLQYRTVNGNRMAYADEGSATPQPQGLGRLVACDLIGMGGSDKLQPSGPDRYHCAEERHYSFALWDDMDLGHNVTLVLQDCASVFGFDWANQRAPQGWVQLPIHTVGVEVWL